MSVEPHRHGQGNVAGLEAPADQKTVSPFLASKRSRSKGGAGGKVKLRGTKEVSTTPAPSEEELRALDKKKRNANLDVGWMTYIVFYMLSSFAYWFGARRFDMDGGKDFDPTDMDMMISHTAECWGLAFSSPVAKKVRRQRHDVEQKKNTKKQKEIIQRSTKLGEAWSEELGSLAVSAGDAEDDGEMAELPTVEHRRQHRPFFCVLQCILLFALWAAYGFSVDIYEQVGYQVPWEDSWIISVQEKGFARCESACSDVADCKGFAHDFALTPSCILLSSVARGESNENPATFGVYQYEKQTSKDFADYLRISAGLENLFPGESALGGQDFCEDISWQLHRLFSYQFTQRGLVSLLFNLFWMFLLSIPLEGAYGSPIVFVIWNLGVIGGGLTWMVWDTKFKTVGAEAGSYCLLAVHLTDLFLNWKQKHLRLQTLVCLAILVFMDALTSAATFGTSGTTFSINVGGAFSGFLVGLIFCTNLQNHKWERMVQLCVVVVSTVISLWALLTWFVGNAHPATSGYYNTVSGDTTPYCWVGQVCVAEAYGGTCDAYTFPETKCVRCQTRECVESWYPEANIYFTGRADVDTVCEEIGYDASFDVSR